MGSQRGFFWFGARVLLYAGWLAKRDVPNVARYVRDAPLWAQRIWIEPRGVDHAILGYGNEYSALVSGGDWDHEREPVNELPKVAGSYERWGKGKSWEESGVFDYVTGLILEQGEFDGCRSHNDLVRRYERIDELYESVVREGRLRTQRELRGARAFRELGGVRIHIGREGQALFGGAGQHRLAMAQILGIPRIPAQIGMVHSEALRMWKQAYE